MAIYHNSVSIVKRSAGKSAVAAAAYRSGEKLTDEQTGIIHDYSRKSGVDHSVILSPVKADWITDRAKLWNKIEEVEKRGDSQLAREITVSIPRELSRDNQIQLVCEYVQKNYIDLGMIADVNFHSLNGDNAHAHIMVSMRDLTINERGDVSFAGKNRAWNHKNLLIKNREDWAKIANEYLIEAGYPDIQIDHRSNADRGIETIPQIHLGIEAAAMRKKGIKSELGDRYDRIDIANNNIRQKLQQIFESESVTRDLERQLSNFMEARYKNIYQHQNIEIPKEVKEPPKPPEPAYPKPDKWSLKKQIDPQLVRAILQIGDEIGTNYKASGYQIQIDVVKKEIEVKYQDNVAMIVYPQICQALLIDHTYTFKQYEWGLKKSIDILLTNLEQQRQAELEQKLVQLEQPMQPELEQQLEQSEQPMQPELIIDSPKIDAKPLVNKNRSRGSGWNR